MQTISENWQIILAALLPLIKVIVNLTPSEKDNKVFEWLDKLIDYFIPNLKKDGGVHNNNIAKKK